ncbi:MAG: gamma-glutamyl-gamma-aminobutyrate hydrolase family protein [Chloroflexi bacterium]|nr:gamma-glutamyl-gamma-aminobutyrate hydrolase family protein [Chloroflexota bacterium]
MKPNIAVPHWLAPDQKCTDYYYEALTGAGADYTVVEDDDLPNASDGLLLLGGVDLDPDVYAREPHANIQKVNRPRDDNELALLRRALERDIPVLCICRGHQLLQVAMGGTLMQDLDGPMHKWVNGTDSNWHDVAIEGGRVAEIYGVGTIEVNSRHHQGVTDEILAPGLTVTARSDDRLIEGYDSDSHRWVVGVQWHPERPEMRPAADPLFRAFVEACES